MNTAPSPLRKTIVGVLILVITVLHFSTAGDNMTFHVLHRELYFLPILLGAFWFGRNSGFMVALIVSFLYTVYILSYPGGHVGLATLAPQVFVFLLVGTMLGWLADREKGYQKKRMIDNDVIILGRAASAVAHEMKEILAALRKMIDQGGVQPAEDGNKNIRAELRRLERMVDILTSYAGPEESRAFSHDLNEVIRERVRSFRKTAAEKGVSFVTEPDPKGCPSWIDPGQVGWILDRLVENALEVSGPGRNIYISSERGGESCTLVVRDEGPGIRPEHLEKIFRPFFTTKPDGRGLALAGCRKSIEDMGGTISVAGTLGQGATFTLVVPREHAGRSLAEDTAQAVFHGRGTGGLYRE